jgi:hypothetical protein
MDTKMTPTPYENRQKAVELLKEYQEGDEVQCRVAKWGFYHFVGLSEGIRLLIEGHDVRIKPKETTKMQDDTNGESDEAYQRRQEIRKLMELPRGTRFQYKDKNYDHEFVDCAGEPAWEFNRYDYRPKPQKRKVLRPLSEIIAMAEANNTLEIDADGGFVKASDRHRVSIIWLGKVVGQTKEELGMMRDYPEAWFRETAAWVDALKGVESEDRNI